MSIKEPNTLTPTQSAIIEKLRQEERAAYDKYHSLRSEMYAAQRAQEQAQDRRHQLEQITKSMNWRRHENRNCNGLQINVFDWLYASNNRFCVTISTRENCTKKPHYMTAYVTGTSAAPLNMHKLFPEDYCDNANGHPTTRADGHAIIKRFNTWEEAERAALEWKMKLIEKFSETLLYDFCFSESITPEQADFANWKKILTNRLKIQE